MAGMWGGGVGESGRRDLFPAGALWHPPKPGGAAVRSGSVRGQPRPAWPRTPSSRRRGRRGPSLAQDRTDLALEGCRSAPELAAEDMSPRRFGDLKPRSVGIPHLWELRPFAALGWRPVGPRCWESATVRCPSVKLRVREVTGLRKRAQRRKDPRTSPPAQREGGLVCAASPHQVLDSLLEMLSLGAEGPSSLGRALQGGLPLHHPPSRSR